MKKWEKIILSPSNTVLEAMKVINDNALQFALVLNEKRELIGSVTDGDIRRGFLRGVNLDSPVDLVANHHPLTLSEGYSKDEVLDLMNKEGVSQIPIKNKSGVIINVVFKKDILEKPTRDNYVVIMAGGLGSRLGELTKDCPKPMLQVGNRPLLEQIILSIKKSGFRNFILCINYKADLIRNYFGDGKKLGVNITYVQEETKLGTAGALSLINQKIEHPFLVMNGDIISRINFEDLLDYHLNHNSIGTMCVRKYDLQVPYGVVEIEDKQIHSIKEKPIKEFFVNAGIYVLDPKALEHIPFNSHLDMTTLFEKFVTLDLSPQVYQIREYWLDIGQLDDLEQAQKDASEKVLL